MSGSPIADVRTEIRSLGPCKFPSPLGLSRAAGDLIPDYVPDDARVLVNVEVHKGGGDLSFEKAGPRATLYFDPAEVTAGIVTAGGLCPGINNVIRSLVYELWHRYGTRHIWGFRYGLEGMIGTKAEPAQKLSPETVKHIHKMGGSVLGLSRGGVDLAAIVSEIAARKLDMLFLIGGDGTARAAHAISQEAFSRGLALSVVAIPKTIDNDVSYVDKTFGFDTAVEVARQAVDAAHTEALSARMGVGIVKLMGRDAGFIAASATLASHDVNYCFVPEVPCVLSGPSGFLEALGQRLVGHGHAVIVVAEGCAKQLLSDPVVRDASGNARYGGGSVDVGLYLRDAVSEYVAGRFGFSNVKYIDPSYMVRSVPAGASDAIFCDTLARGAVHAAMAGKTDLLMGRWHRVFTHVPLSLSTTSPKRIDPDGALWLSVIEATGQARYL